MMKSADASWEQVSPPDRTPEQGLNASAHHKAMALQFLDGVIPEDRQAALARIGAAYTAATPEERYAICCLSADAVRSPWAQLSVTQIDHALMTVVHHACGDFRSALSIVHGIPSKTGNLDLDV